MKRVVADFVAVAHGENGTSCGLQGGTVDLVVR